MLDPPPTRCYLVHYNRVVINRWSNRRHHRCKQYLAVQFSNQLPTITINTAVAERAKPLASFFCVRYTTDLGLSPTTACTGKPRSLWMAALDTGRSTLAYNVWVDSACYLPWDGKMNSSFWVVYQIPDGDDDVCYWPPKGRRLVS